jgi:acetyl-CoA C-acetyltransferase
MVRLTQKKIPTMAPATIVITHALRTPIGKFMGSFKSLTAVELGSALLNNLIAQADIDRALIDQVILGSARQAGLGPNPARQIACKSGLPDETLAMTVNQACGSGLRSIILGFQELRLGEADVVVAGGMESMSNVPFLLPKFREGYVQGDGTVVDVMYQDGFLCPMTKKVMGVTVEDLAKAEDISREEQDIYAARSQGCAEKARKEGRFRNEITPIMVGDTLIEDDEHPRDGITAEKLAKLPAVFRRPGSVSAGNSSGITDGAAMVLMMTEEKATELGLPILAVMENHATAGLEPALMGLGPVPSIKKLLKRCSASSVNDYDLIEINEAFAAQVIACERALEIERDRLNVNGGAIALGHPIGATGARIVCTLLHELKRQNKKRGLASLCVSGGYGVSAAFTVS